MSKQAVLVPSDNPVYGESSSAFRKYGYSPAVKAGNLMFIAGVVGVRTDGSVPDSIGEQANLAFERLKELLRLEGLGMADLVEVVSYHVDIEENLGDFISVKERYFETPFPTWTILGVAGLARRELKIEIKCVALIAV